MVDLYEIQYRSYVIKADLNAILILSHIFRCSKMSNIQISEVDEKCAAVSVGP
jgi:hypothetical protein